jgi:hypothetical protein
MLELSYFYAPSLSDSFCINPVHYRINQLMFFSNTIHNPQNLVSIGSAVFWTTSGG